MCLLNHAAMLADNTNAIDHCLVWPSFSPFLLYIDRPFGLLTGYVLVLFTVSHKLMHFPANEEDFAS